MDLLVIATSDANKPLLKDSIIVLLKALKLRGEVNPPMVKDIVNIYLQLTFDPDCLKLLHENCEIISKVLKSLVVSGKYTTDTLIALHNLLHAIEEEKLQPRHSSKLSQVILAKKKDDLPSDKRGNFIRRASSTIAGSLAVQDRHIMLSYSRDVKFIVEIVDKKLREAGFKVWVD